MHRYNNQDHSMLAANMAVGAMTNSGAAKADIWRINAEDDYHEDLGQRLRAARDGVNTPGPSVVSSDTMGSSSRIAAAFAMLCLPYLALAAWLVATGKLASVTAFVASVLSIGGFLAVIARTWRRFFWLNAPFWLLALVFAGYTLTYGDVPGELLGLCARHFLLGRSSRVFRYMARRARGAGIRGTWRHLFDSGRSLAADAYISAEHSSAAFRALSCHCGALRGHCLESRPQSRRGSRRIR